MLIVEYWLWTTKYRAYCLWCYPSWPRILEMLRRSSILEPRILSMLLTELMLTALWNRSRQWYTYWLGVDSMQGPSLLLDQVTGMEILNAGIENTVVWEAVFCSRGHCILKTRMLKFRRLKSSLLTINLLEWKSRKLGPRILDRLSLLSTRLLVDWR